MVGNDIYQEDTKKQRNPTRHFDESLSGEFERSGRDKFRADVFMTIIDQLNTALVYLAAAYSDVHT